MEHTTIQQRSPLDTLVRRASSRRTRPAAPNVTVTPPTTPPRQAGPSAPPPAPSPLLHTRFRTSTTTFSEYDTTTSDARSMLSYAHAGDAPRGSYAGYDFDDITSSYRDSYRPPDPGTPRALQPIPSPADTLPTVVVSPEHELEDPYGGVSDSKTGRVPSRVPATGGGINFSRPGLPLVDRSDERKRQVLARNQNASPTPSYSPSTSPIPPSSSLLPQHPGGLSPNSQQAFSQNGQGARPASPTSLYSSYSYYPPEAIVPSPTTPTMPVSHPNATLTPNYAPSHASPAARSPTPTSAGPRTAQEYLQLGIQHHEANRLAESAVCFEQAATVGGGCGVGMLMWGLAQRHGWGCVQSERAGFKWLRRAAEVALGDLEGSKSGNNVGAVKSELVIAIYEVGQSFYRGWGVEKDKNMAVNYYRVAARMGDPDAQQDLAFCLANGKGCKKDKREAAKWYRAAVAQGVSDIGLAWIYKEKYQ